MSATVHPATLASQPVTATVKLLRCCLAWSGWPKTMLEFAEADVWRWVVYQPPQQLPAVDEEDPHVAPVRLGRAEITANKRAIDGYNQARNDATERADEFLLMSLGLIDPATAGGDQQSPASARMRARTAKPLAA